MRNSLLFKIPVVLLASYGIYRLIKAFTDTFVIEHDMNGHLHQKIADQLPIAKKVADRFGQSRQLRH